MIIQYKDLRHTIEQFRWDLELDRLDGISYKDCKLQTRLCKTAKIFILKYCTSYYKYKKLFYNYPKVNPPALIELEQFIRPDEWIINDSKSRKYDKNLQCGSKRLSDVGQDREKDEDKSDSFSFYSVLSQIAQNKKCVIKNKIKNMMTPFFGNNNNDTNNNKV